MYAPPPHTPNLKIMSMHYIDKTAYFVALVAVSRDSVSDNYLYCLLLQYVYLETKLNYLTMTSPSSSDDLTSTNNN